VPALLAYAAGEVPTTALKSWMKWTWSAAASP